MERAVARISSPDDSEDLQESDNPFDLAQLAAARAWRANKDEIKRFEYLKEFIRMLNKKGMSHLSKYRLVKFLETIFKIRKTELKHDYVAFLRKENEKEEETMLIIEELAIKRGKAEGIAKGEAKGIIKGKLETARKLLDMGLGFDIISKATGLTEAQIRT